MQMYACLGRVECLKTCTHGGERNMPLIGKVIKAIRKHEI